MNRWFATPAMALLLAMTGSDADAQDGRKLELLRSCSVSFPVAEEKVLQGGRKDEFFVIGVHGEVRRLEQETGKLVGALNLPEPSRSLLAFVRLTKGADYHLVVVSPRGVHAYARKDGLFAPPAKRLMRRGRFTLRVGRPRLANIGQDVNGDGNADLVLPGPRSCTLYLNEPSAKAGVMPRFVRVAQLDVRVSASANTEAEALSMQLRSEFRIPDLETIDVNGDGRLDLVAASGRRHFYHLQRADGRLPEKADVVLDLGIFRDTTPKGSVELGQTIGQDRTIVRARDLNDDGIQDYVIAHRRKVWMFLGTKRGPQFEDPATILKLAEDVTFLTLMHLDADALPDLLLFKVQVPTLARLLQGLLFDWDITVKSIGYANDKGERFARTPKWRGETTLRVPSILGLVRNPEKIVKRFQEIGRKFRHVVQGDLNGDGKTDILMQSEDRKQLQYWLMASGAVDDKLTYDARARALLFEDENRVWDIERIFGLLQSIAEDRTAQLTRGRKVSGSIALRDPEEYRLEFAATADLDGDGRSEVILHYLSLTEASRSVLDIIRLRS